MKERDTATEGSFTYLLKEGSSQGADQSIDVQLSDLLALKARKSFHHSTFLF